MNELKKTKNSSWFWLVEIWLILLFMSNAILSFFFNLLNYGWNHNINWLRLDVSNMFSLSGWDIKAMAFFMIVVLIPTSIFSFLLLIFSIRKPFEFKSMFKWKIWYSIFSLQIMSWAVI